MRKTVRARVINGRLEPADRLDLAEGAEVTITIVELAGPKDLERSRRAAGSWKGIIDAEELIRNIYADRLLSTRPEPRL